MTRLCRTVAGVILSSLLVSQPVAVAEDFPSPDSTTAESQLIPLQSTDVSLDMTPVGQQENTEVHSVSGGQQALIVVPDETAPKQYEFTFNLDNSSSIVSIDGYLFVEKAGEIVARISSPWAYDAANNPVKTYLTTDGNTVMQHFETDANTKYPIVADPRWNVGNISGHIYFSKEETRKIAAGGASSAAVGPFWLAVPPPAGPAIFLWWEKNSVDVAIEATGAVRAGKCLQLKVGYIGLSSGVIGVQPGTYTEGCA